MDPNQTIAEQRDFLTRIVSILEKVGIPYLITGSIGSSIHGEPRATRDIDVIITPTVSQLRSLIREIEPYYYISAEAARDALNRTGMFNVIDGYTSNKADLIITKNTPFEGQKFQRRIRTEYLGMEIFVATAEDIALSKLSWYKETGSEKQLLDIKGIIAVQGERLDRDYLRKWAKELGVEETLEMILVEADKI